jgi:hypothetical protein
MLKSKTIHKSGLLCELKLLKMEDRIFDTSMRKACMNEVGGSFQKYKQKMAGIKITFLIPGMTSFLVRI